VGREPAKYVPEGVLDDLKKPLCVYIIELRHDVPPGDHATYLCDYLGRKVYYGLWSVTGAYLEFRLATARCPMQRAWYRVRLWLYRRLPASRMNFWKDVANIGEYPVITAAGIAAMTGRVVRI
jgi:hypothetical protein